MPEYPYSSVLKNSVSVSPGSIALTLMANPFSRISACNDLEKLLRYDFVAVYTTRDGPGVSDTIVETLMIAPSLRLIICGRIALVSLVLATM